jgi:hypothetical protein
MSKADQWKSIYDAVIWFFQLMWQVFWGLFAEDFFTKPFNIVRIILFILSVFGIWLGREKSKLLFIFVSIVMIAWQVITFKI